MKYNTKDSYMLLYAFQNNYAAQKHNTEKYAWEAKHVWPLRICVLIWKPNDNGLITNSI